jgi:hypothetical protein
VGLSMKVCQKPQGTYGNSWGKCRGQRDDGRIALKWVQKCGNPGPENPAERPARRQGTVMRLAELVTGYLGNKWRIGFDRV